MRDYAKVSPQFWIGKTGKALKKAGPEAMVVSLYLMTCPHANMIGLFYMPLMYVAHETGLGLEGASKGLQRAIEAGFCAYDDETEMVWVHEMARFQIAESLSGKDLRIKGVQNEYDSLPDNPYLAGFYDRYHRVFCMTRKRGPGSESKSPLQAPSEPLASQEQEQEQEQELTTDAYASADSDPASRSLTAPAAACPADALVSLYHELMPDNPRCKVLSAARRGAIRSRWKEAARLDCKPFGYSNREEGLAAWRAFFEICADSPFLTGRAQPMPGKPPFVADIDFLMSPSGFARTLENKYHREAA